VQALLQERNKEIEIMKSKTMKGSYIDTTAIKTQVIQNLQTKIVVLSAEVERLTNELNHR